MNGISAINLINFFSATSIDANKAKDFGFNEDKFAQYDTNGDGELSIYEIMDNEDAVEVFLEEFNTMFNPEEKDQEKQEV